MLISLLSRRAALRCALCHDELVASESTCPGCGAAFHFECSAGLGGCTSSGCRHRSGRLIFRDPGRSRIPWFGVGALTVALLFVFGATAFSCTVDAQRESAVYRTRQLLAELARLRRDGARFGPGVLVFRDAWGNPIRHAERAGGWILWSCGPDGVDDRGRGDDIAVTGD